MSKSGWHSAAPRLSTDAGEIEAAAAAATAAAVAPSGLSSSASWAKAAVPTDEAEVVPLAAAAAAPTTETDAVDADAALAAALAQAESENSKEVGELEDTDAEYARRRKTRARTGVCWAAGLQEASDGSFMVNQKNNNSSINVNDVKSNTLQVDNNQEEDTEYVRKLRRMSVQSWGAGKAEALKYSALSASHGLNPEELPLSALNDDEKQDNRLQNNWMVRVLPSVEEPQEAEEEVKDTRKKFGEIVLAKNVYAEESCALMKTEDVVEDDETELYRVIEDDPRFLSVLAKYCPKILTLKGAIRKGKNTLDPEHIPILGIVSKCILAGKAHRSMQVVEKVKQTNKSAGNLTLKRDLQLMHKNTKAFTARQHTRNVLTIACVPVMLIPIPFLGVPAWFARKGIEAGVDQAAIRAQKLHKATGTRDKLFNDWWATKAFLIYLGLPANGEALYGEWEGARLQLKGAYGAHPDDDLRKMEPGIKTRNKMKSMEMKNNEYDLEKLGVSMLVVLWHAYRCWDLVYWDYLREKKDKVTGQRAKHDEERFRRHQRRVAKDLSRRHPNVHKVKAKDCKEVLEQVLVRACVKKDETDFITGLSPEARTWFLQSIIERMAYLKRLWAYKADDGKVLAISWVDPAGQKPEKLHRTCALASCAIMGRFKSEEFGKIVTWGKATQKVIKQQRKRRLGPAAGLGVIRLLYVLDDSEEAKAAAHSLVQCASHAPTPSMYIGGENSVAYFEGEDFEKVATVEKTSWNKPLVVLWHNATVKRSVVNLLDDNGNVVSQEDQDNLSSGDDYSSEEEGEEDAARTV